MPSPQNYYITVYNTDSNGAVGQGSLELAENDSGSWSGQINLNLDNVGSVDTALTGSSISNGANLNEIELGSDQIKLVVTQNPFLGNQSLAGSAVYGALVYNLSAAPRS